MQIIAAPLLMLRAAEVGQHIVPAPSLAPELAPAVVVRMLAAKAPAMLRNPIVMTCGLIYMALNFGLISLTSWMPTVIRTFGFPVSQVGWVTMTAPLTAAAVMIVWGRWSDRRQERVLNTAAALLVGAAGWTLAAIAPDHWLTLLGFIIAAIGVYATYALSFAISQTYVAPESRPVAIAVIGVVGNIGGVFVPIIVGTIRTATGSFTGGFLLVAAVMAIAGLATVRLRHQVAPAAATRVPA